MRDGFILVEKVFGVLALLMYQGAVIGLLLSGGSDEGDIANYDATPIRAIYLLIYIITFFLLVLRWRKTIYFLNRNWLTWALILLSVLSIFWSSSKDASIKDSFTLVGSSLFGVYLISRYSLKDILKLASWSFYVIIFLSIVFAIGLPKYGLMAGQLHAGKWRGVYTHKNGLGISMAISGTIFLIRSYAERLKNPILWGGFGLSIALLLLSGSASAMLNFLALVMAFFVFRIMRWSYSTMIPTLIGISTIGIGLNFWAVNNADILFGAIGKDPTLTGRKGLWLLVWEMIWKQPWFGYGYGGFWHGYDGESSYIWLATSFHPAHAHSGYLTILLELGFVGLIIFWLGFSLNLFKALVCLRSSEAVEDIWAPIFFVYLLIINQSESGLIASNSMDWIFYIAISLSLDEKYKYNQRLLGSRTKYS
jgi:exopolysaccharide production protein ExoQ